jgi:ABC-type uncharacterized transport system ATPase subunit
VPPNGPVLHLRGITKTYPGVVANHGVDLEVAGGTVRGLLGENGAGKSTLMKILFGMTRPDAGTIEVEGVERRFRSPADAIAAGIGMVQQHFSLVPDFTVAENLVLGSEPRVRRLFTDRKRAEADVQALADRYGFRLDAGARVADLAVGARQRVEILKALHRGARILVLDEPTAALAPQEVDELFTVVRSLQAQGCTIILITHKLPEIVAICDEATVLRDGVVVGTRVLHDHERVPGPARDALEVELARLMVGRALPEPPVRASTSGGPVLTLAGVGDGARVGPLDIQVRAGEIVGVAGVEGNGQTELIELILGVRRCRSGRIDLAGRDVTRLPVGTRLRQGVAHIAEDRHAAAVAADLSVADNCALGHQGRPPLARSGGRLSHAAVEQFAAEVVARYRVRTPSLRATVAQLSGGNQQKLVVGREVARHPKVMIAAQPTRGLDVGATAFVHQELVELRDAGCAVLLVSLDLTEVLALADRIVVMRGGVVVGEGRPDELDELTIGAWMTGGAEVPA